jgi:hypothetical protein
MIKISRENYNFLALIKMLKSLIQVITDKKIDGEMPICIADEKFKLTIIYGEQAIPGEKFN